MNTMKHTCPECDGVNTFEAGTTESAPYYRCEDCGNEWSYPVPVVDTSEGTASNIALILAAPKTLKALERLVEDMEREIRSEYEGTSRLEARLAEIDYAREAIAEAKGLA